MIRDVPFWRVQAFSPEFKVQSKIPTGILFYVLCITVIFGPNASIPCEIHKLHRRSFRPTDALYSITSIFGKRSCSLSLNLRGGHAAPLSPSSNATGPEVALSHSSAAEDGDDDISVVYLDSDEMVVEDPGAVEAAGNDEQLPDEDDGADSAGGELRMYADDSTRCIAHGAPVYAVALSPFDEDLLATGGGDDGVLLWSASGRGGGGPRALGGFTDSVAALAFSHDGTFLAAGAMDATCKARILP
jgi:hypothetical protein